LVCPSFQPPNSVKSRHAASTAPLYATQRKNMTTEDRFTRIENILSHVVDRQEQLDTALVTLAEAQTKLTEAQARLTEAQAKTDTQLRALGLVVEATERQWQAYLTTIRPQ
jgi:hypothetical protein